MNIGNLPPKRITKQDSETVPKTTSPAPGCKGIHRVTSNTSPLRTIQASCNVLWCNTSSWGVSKGGRTWQESHWNTLDVSNQRLEVGFYYQVLQEKSCFSFWCGIFHEWPLCWDVANFWWQKSYILLEGCCFLSKLKTEFCLFKHLKSLQLWHFSHYDLSTREIYCLMPFNEEDHPVKDLCSEPMLVGWNAM